MTALKPIENRRVRAVPSESYPLNEMCAHPTCREQTADPHHIFPRSMIAGKSWFVEITSDNEDGSTVEVIVPHVAGVCRAHHDAVEEHRAWIKLEEGSYVWYDHTAGLPFNDWKSLGPLNPQPGSKNGKPKRRPPGQAKAGLSQTYTIRAPKGEEMSVLLELLDTCSELIQKDLEAPEPPLRYATIAYLCGNYLAGK